MASTRRVPGELLVARAGARLARVSRVADAGGLAARLQGRLHARAVGAHPLTARLERWERSPMVGWAGALLGEGSHRPFAWPAAPPAIFALPDSAEADPAQPAQRRVRSRRVVPTSRRAAPSLPAVQGGPDVVTVPASAHGAAVVRQPAPRGAHRVGVLQRAGVRGRVVDQALPIRSVWASRQLATAEPLASFAAPRAASPQASRSERLAGGPRHQPVPRTARRSTLPAPQRQLAWPLEPTMGGEPRPGAGAPPPARGAAAGPQATARGAEAGPQAAARGRGTSAFDLLERRHHQPVGLVAARLGTPAQPSHPAARGLEAARGDQDPQADSDTAREPREPLPHPGHPARSMLHALARAGSSQEAVRVVMERASDPQASRDLPAPLADVVQQIKQQVQHAAQQAKLVAPSARVAQQAEQRRQAEPDLPAALMRLTRGGGGSDSGEVVSLATMRLIRRLQQLVHIAETDRRLLEAQRRVRMAEASGHARAEGSATPGTDSAGEAQPVDLDTLGREVLAAVTDKLASRNDRRLEDPDVPIDVF